MHSEYGGTGGTEPDAARATPMTPTDITAADRAAHNICARFVIGRRRVITIRLLAVRNPAGRGGIVLLQKRSRYPSQPDRAGANARSSGASAGSPAKARSRAFRCAAARSRG